MEWATNSLLGICVIRGILSARSFLTGCTTPLSSLFIFLVQPSAPGSQAEVSLIGLVCPVWFVFCPKGGTSTLQNEPAQTLLFLAVPAVVLPNDQLLQALDLPPFPDALWPKADVMEEICDNLSVGCFTLKTTLVVKFD